MSRRRRPAPRRLGFRVGLAAGLVVLAGGMLLSVERGSRARRVSDRLSALDRQTVEARARLGDAVRRLDSLSSRERIVVAAARLGLHPANDADITFLRADSLAPDDAAPSSSTAGRRRP